MAKYSGALELTWTNKHLTLLAHNDVSYEWVNPDDYRVSEVRLLRDAGSVGEARPEDQRVGENLLIRGDALHALTSLVKLPEFATRFRGQVKLVYIDPPFNTGETFLHYDDNLEHSVWLTMMRDRLMQVRELLAPDGSLWVHLDDDEMAYCKVVLDEVFGRSSFLATVAWQKRTSRDNRAAFSSSHDHLLVYSPAGTDWKETRNRLVDEGGYSNPDDDPLGPWRSVPLSAQAGHATASQFYTIETPTGVQHDPPKGRAWTYTKDRFGELVQDGRVYWPRDGDGRPRLKMYPWESKGLVPFTIWPANEVGENLDAKKHIMALFPDLEPFDTPKPERLMQRILQIATKPGDLVLDCFAGSGTTAAVAHKMNRQWAAVEWSDDTLRDFAVPRLRTVVKGEDPGGITDAVGWQGGGGFQILDVQESMFDAQDGMVFLADWAVAGSLAEATAAQLGYTYEPEPPFAGRQGRTRLAVLEGLANVPTIDLFLELLNGDERLVLCATGVSSDVAEHLRSRSPGSKVRKIPASLLNEYRKAYRERRGAELRLAELASETTKPVEVAE